MAGSRSAESHALTNVPGTCSLMFLLERGLEYMQRECYAEGVTLLALARERLAPDQIHLADVIDVFLQGYAEYQRIQRTLQEVSRRFAEAYVKQQAIIADFEKALLILMKEIDSPDQLPAIPTAAKHTHSSLSPSLLFQDLQMPSASSMPSLLMKDNTPLPELSITCFGHFEVRRLGKVVTLCSSRNGQSILRYLVAKSGHYATSDALQAMLWPEAEPEVAQRKLHIAISALRRSLNDGVICESGCGYIICKNSLYRLNPAVTIRTDVEEFLHYYQTGQKRGQEQVALYEKACLLYTGPFLLEDIQADWSFLQWEQLSRTYLTLCRALTDHYLKVKCYEEAVKWATAILKEDHCDEASHRQLIQIYAAQGRRSEALQQYQRCERLLREELGVPPLPETVQVFQTLLNRRTYLSRIKWKHSKSTQKI